MVSSKNSDMMASIPTKARITVSRGAAGKVMLVLNSSICKNLSISEGFLYATWKYILRNIYVNLQQVDDEDKYLMLRISERGPFRESSSKHGKK